MDQFLKGKTALITGSTSGIGKALARGFSELGANIVLTGRDQERLESTKRVLEQFGTKILAVACDVQEYDEVKQMCEYVVEELGQVHILINNAGYAKIKKITKLKVKEFQDMIKTNILGVYNCTHAIVPHMIEKQEGTILNTGSVAVNYALAGWSAYGMTKSALLSFTTCLAIELKKEKINVNTIMPNVVNTPMLRSGRTEEEIKQLHPIEASELVPYYAFFASEKGRKVTGLNIDIDIVKAILQLPEKLDLPKQKVRNWDDIQEYAKSSLRSEEYSTARKYKKLINFLMIQEELQEK